MDNKETTKILRGELGNKTTNKYSDHGRHYNLSRGWCSHFSLTMQSIHSKYYVVDHIESDGHTRGFCIKFH